MNWSQLLHYLAGPGVAVAVGLIVSELAERSSWYARLTAQYKRLVFYALCLVVPMGATVFGVAFDSWPNVWATTWYGALVAAFIASGIGTLYHTRKLASKDECDCGCE